VPAEVSGGSTVRGSAVDGSSRGGLRAALKEDNMNGSPADALLGLRRTACRARGSIVYSDIDGWRVGLARGLGGVEGWYLSASLYPRGRTSTDRDWGHLGAALGILGASRDALLTPIESTPSSAVFHWAWGGPPEWRTSMRALLARRHALPIGWGAEGVPFEEACDARDELRRQWERRGSRAAVAEWLRGVGITPGPLGHAVGALLRRPRDLACAPREVRGVPVIARAIGDLHPQAVPSHEDLDDDSETGRGGGGGGGFRGGGFRRGGGRGRGVRGRPLLWGGGGWWGGYGPWWWWYDSPPDYLVLEEGTEEPDEETGDVDTDFLPRVYGLTPEELARTRRIQREWLASTPIRDTWFGDWLGLDDPGEPARWETPPAQTPPAQGQPSVELSPHAPPKQLVTECGYRGRNQEPRRGAGLSSPDTGAPLGDQGPAAAEHARDARAHHLGATRRHDVTKDEADIARRYGAAAAEAHIARAYRAGDREQWRRELHIANPERLLRAEWARTGAEYTLAFRGLLPGETLRIPDAWPYPPAEERRREHEREEWAQGEPTERTDPPLPPVRGPTAEFLELVAAEDPEGPAPAPEAPPAEHPSPEHFLALVAAEDECEMPPL
jgi:hypothetical protein